MQEINFIIIQKTCNLLNFNRNSFLLEKNYLLKVALQIFGQTQTYQLLLKEVLTLKYLIEYWDQVPENQRRLQNHLHLYQ